VKKDFHLEIKAKGERGKEGTRDRFGQQDRSGQQSNRDIRRYGAYRSADNVVCASHLAQRVRTREPISLGAYIRVSQAYSRRIHTRETVISSTYICERQVLRMRTYALSRRSKGQIQQAIGTRSVQGQSVVECFARFVVFVFFLSGPFSQFGSPL
jgi:hypothetical protein